MRFTGYMACVLFSVVPAVPAYALQKKLEVQPATAANHLVKKIEPEYPVAAKPSRLQGTVVIQATISKQGAVTDLKILSGHPSLISAAITAVKQWRYKPFLVGGQPSDIITVVEVPFSLGIPVADYKKEQAAGDAYFKQQDNCRELLRLQQYAKAEPICKIGVELAEKLPASRQMERLIAYQFAGHSLWWQRKFKDALGFYQRELAIAEANLQPTDAELGYAYHDVARGLHTTGDLQRARSYYERAETTLELARGRIEMESLKNKYSWQMKAVLGEYAILLRQTGDVKAAEAAEQRANAIVVKSNVKE